MQSIENECIVFLCREMYFLYIYVRARVRVVRIIFFLIYQNFSGYL